MATLADRTHPDPCLRDPFFFLFFHFRFLCALTTTSGRGIDLSEVRPEPAIRATFFDTQTPALLMFSATTGRNFRDFHLLSKLDLRSLVQCDGAVQRSAVCVTYIA